MFLLYLVVVVKNELSIIWKKNSRSLKQSWLLAVATEFKRKNIKTQYCLFLELLTPEVCLVLFNCIWLLVLMEKNVPCFLRFISYVVKCNDCSQPIGKHSYSIRAGIITLGDHPYLVLYSGLSVVVTTLQRRIRPLHWLCINELKFTCLLGTHSKVPCF